jgi:hypothetical protein
VIRQGRLLDSFCDFYPRGILDYVGALITSRGGWLTRMTRGLVRQSVLHHLLLLRFFNIDVEAFFVMKEPDPPFGPGSWPCLNRAADHCGALLIERCTVSTRQQSPWERSAVRRASLGIYATGVTLNQRTEHERTGY